MSPMAPVDMPSWLTSSLQSCSLDNCGLIVLANLKAVARRTALTGNSTFSDALVLCPGLQNQQEAPELNHGEYPACANMDSDYVFRVENQATVTFMQKVGRTGHLTTLIVRKQAETSGWANILKPVLNFQGFPSVPSCSLMLAATLTVVVLIVMATIHDWRAVVGIALLVLARLLNVIAIQRRAAGDWFGASEPGNNELLILLSQDRWIRLKGQVNDLKRVTSGQWLRDPSFLESAIVGVATLLVYLSAVIFNNASQLSKILVIALLLTSAALLGLANECTDTLQMHGCVIEIMSKPVAYKRRRDMADELIKEKKRDAWAVRLGMIHPKKSDSGAEPMNGGPPTM